MRPLSASVLRLWLALALGLWLCACSYLPAGLLPEREPRLAAADLDSAAPIDSTRAAAIELPSSIWRSTGVGWVAEVGA